MSTIHYSNANVDYLSKPLQSKIYSKTPYLPINIEKLEDKIEFFKDIHSFVNKIKHTKNYMSFMAPSIYIVVDSTLRLGYSAKLIEIMNSEVGAGTIIFSDPYLKTSDVFFPLYRSNKLRVVTQPFNMNDNCETLIEIIKKECKSGTIILPSKYKYCMKNDPQIKNRTVFIDDNSVTKFDLDGSSGLLIKPQIYNNLRWKNVEELIGKKLVNSDTLICVVEGGLIQDQGKLRLEIAQDHPTETQAIRAVP